MAKLCQNSLKYPPWTGPGGPTNKNFFQKVITHQDGTFLGQKFFSKTNILGGEGNNLTIIKIIIYFPEFSGR